MHGEELSFGDGVCDLLGVMNEMRDMRDSLTPGVGYGLILLEEFIFWVRFIGWSFIQFTPLVLPPSQQLLCCLSIQYTLSFFWLAVPHMTIYY